MQRDEPSSEKPFQFSLNALLWFVMFVAIAVAFIEWFWVLGLIAVAICLVGVIGLEDGPWRERAVAVFGVLVFSCFLVGCAGIIFGFSFAFFSKTPQPRNLCANNLKAISLAVLEYNDANRALPPAFIVDETGCRSHSWRVLVLPYMEAGNVYDAYDFDQPWNSPTNAALAIDIDTFYCPSDPANHKARCNYVAVVGPGTMWPDDKTTSLSEVGKGDGARNTIMVVEICDTDLTWPEPRDLDIRTMVKSLNAGQGLGIGSHHQGGANVAFADGRVEFLTEEILAETLEAMLTVDGGETIGDDWE